MDLSAGSDQEKVGLYPSRGVVEDSVHGFIPINEAEYLLLQTPFMRRLHNIKQLGMAYLVFPSARHSRLEHSLGTMHVMSLMAQRIAVLARHNERVCDSLAELECNTKVLDSLTQLARITGLLHDVGHLAYSHMTEEAVKLIAQHGGSSGSLYRALKGDNNELKAHEIYGRSMLLLLSREIDEMPESNGLAYLDLFIGLAATALFEEPLSCHGSPAEKSLEELGLRCGSLTLVHEMISNEIADADRLDYLQRDAKATGIVYGNIDLDRLIHGIGVNVDNEPHLGLDIKSLHTLEDVFDARYKMYRSVYYHHKVIALSKAVTRFMVAAANEWSSLAPPIYGGRSIYDILVPDELARAVANNLYYFDDSEFDMLVKVSLTRGSELAARWALSLLNRRDLLPLSLIKRSEELIIMARNAIEESGLQYSSKVVDNLIDSVIANAGLIAERLKKLVNVDLELDVFRDNVVSPNVMEKSGVKVFGWHDSSYLRALITEGSTPVAYFYAYSNNEKDHEVLRRHAAEIREGAKETIKDIMRESVRSLKA